MSDGVYRGCSTCAAVHRERSGRLICTEGRKVLNLSFAAPSCWRPREQKNKNSFEKSKGE
jgi:hypothetical protein